MKNLLLIFTFILIIFSVKAQTKSDGILGEWLSQEKDAKILIFKQGNKFFGKVTWGTGNSSKDTKNPDPALRSRELIGLVILKDFVFDEDYWKDGTIYDPNSGKTYSCKMKLDSPTALNIRGYMGISMFGRTSIWTRVK